MKMLRIKDNSIYSKDTFFEVEKLTRIIENKTLEELECEGVFVFPNIIKDAKDITKEDMILKKVGNIYHSSNIMGFIGYGEERIVIDSRFSNGDNDYFLQYLLEQVVDFPNVLNLETDSNQDNQLFNYLLFLFPYYLKRAMRKGIYKRYILNKYNDENVKSTIDVKRHIEKNVPFIGNIAYIMREFSYDNYLVELIRHTIEFIKRKPYGNNILFKVKGEIKFVIEVTPNYELYDRSKIINENIKNPIHHAYYKEYKDLQKLCLLILKHEKHNINNGSKQIYGILFDGAWLWEEYINLLIGDLFYHPMNKGGVGAQRLFSENIGLIYPDFISRDDKVRIIADAKYKSIKNIDNKDYLQVLAYMFRFDAKIGYYLYPEDTGNNDLKLLLNSGSTYEKNVTPREDICVIKHGMRIPKDSSSYSEFVTKMKNEEQEFISLFCK